MLRFLCTGSCSGKFNCIVYLIAAVVSLFGDLHVIVLFTDWQTGKSAGAGEEKERSPKRTDIQVAVLHCYLTSH